MERKSNHQVKIVRIENIQSHTNADNLELIVLGGYQVVSRKGTFKIGDLGVYIQPDSVVPPKSQYSFLWEQFEFPDGVIPEKKRRITVRRLRKEWSEGLLLPVTDFPELVNYYVDAKGHPGVYRLQEGMDVSEVLGITHYEPQEEESTPGNNESGPRRQKRKYPRSFKGWFFFLLRKLYRSKLQQSLNAEAVESGITVPEYDVEAYKNFVNAFEPGELVYVTEKIHGSNARFIYVDDKLWVGSRKLWKAPNSKCIWRKTILQHPWIVEWCKNNPGSVLYGEVVPSQKGFEYGTKDGFVKFFPFDIYTPQGNWQKPYVGMSDIPVTAPVLAIVPFDIAEIKAKYVDGKTTVQGANHLREGVVISPVTERHVPGLGRLQLKIVSNAFYEKA